MAVLFFEALWQLMKGFVKTQLLEALQLEEMVATDQIVFMSSGFHVECSQLIGKNHCITPNNWNSCTRVSKVMNRNKEFRIRNSD